MDGRYADVIERALYNSVLSGMSLDAKRFFYVNPLEVVPEACEKDDRLRHVKPQRQKWFGCACCPPNLARLLGSLPSYAFSAGDDTLYLHLYIGGEVCAALDHAEVRLGVESNYPWDGQVRLTVRTPGQYGIAVRVPGWCRGYELKVNGESVSAAPVAGYIHLHRTWQENDTVTLTLEMPVTLMCANPAVREDTGKLCVVRGPWSTAWRKPITAVISISSACPPIPSSKSAMNRAFSAVSKPFTAKPSAGAKPLRKDSFTPRPARRRNGPKLS